MKRLSFILLFMFLLGCGMNQEVFEAMLADQKMEAEQREQLLQDAILAADERTREVEKSLAAATVGGGIASGNMYVAREEYEKAIVLIVADENRIGVGTIIKLDEQSRTAYILTAYHLIEGLDEVRVRIHADQLSGGGVGEVGDIEAIAHVNHKWVDEKEENDFAKHKDIVHRKP